MDIDHEDITNEEAEEIMKLFAPFLLEELNRKKVMVLNPKKYVLINELCKKAKSILDEYEIKYEIDVSRRKMALQDVTIRITTESLHVNFLHMKTFKSIVESIDGITIEPFNDDVRVYLILRDVFIELKDED